MTKPQDAVRLLNVQIKRNPEAVRAGLAAAEKARRTIEARRMKRQARVDVKDMRRAMNLLVGPGFGHPGLSMKEATERLISEGMAPQDAYLAVKAGASLAKDQGIKVRR